MGKRTGVAFVREAFSTEDLKAILSASDRFDWCFDFGRICHWAQTALHFDDYRKEMAARECVAESIKRHVVYRYGIFLASAVDTGSYYYSRPGSLDFVGDDPKMLAALKSLARNLGDRRPHTSSNTANYTDIESYPTGMPSSLQKAYDRVMRTSWPSRDQRELLRSMAREEARALRGGQAPFDAETRPNSSPTLRRTTSCTVSRRGGRSNG